MASRGAWYPLTDQGVQWDEHGNPYYNTSDGRRSYIPPIAAAQYRDDPRMLQWARTQGATIDYDQATGQTTVADTSHTSGNRPLDFRTGSTWDSERGGYKTRFDLGDVATLGAGALVGGGAAAALSGGSGAAGGGTLAANSIPNAHLAVPGAIASQGASAGIPLSASGTLAASSIPGMHAAVPAAIGSQGVSQTLGTAAPATAGRAVMDAASEGGDSLLKKMATPDNIAGLGALIAGLVGSRNNNQQQSEELQRINAITETQMRRADPLHQVATALAFGRMPVNYRQGVQLTNEPLPPR